MRVLHIIVGLDVGGAELMLSRLVESTLNDSAQHHSVVSLSGLGTLGPRLRARGIDVQALGMSSALGSVGAVWRLRALIRRDRPDIVQTWMYHADLLGGIAARLAGVKQVIWGIRTTDVNSRDSRSTAFVRSLCARLSTSVPRLIVCAADASRRSHIAAGYDASRMTVVPNGFDVADLVATPDQRAALRALCGFDDSVTVIGSLGRFHKDKDQENFIAAAGLVAARHPSVRFLMVGRGLERGNAELEEWIGRTGRADRFVLLGERGDVPVCLAAMDIFCLSSLTEGFPNVVGEAMAMALPCVVTDVGDAALLVHDTGVVVAKQDADALAAGMDQLLALDPQQRRRLGQRAQARIHAEFSMPRAVERFGSLYQKLLDEGPT